MCNNNDKADILKQTLFSATRTKLRKESDVLKLRNLERQLNEELASTNAEVEFIIELLKDLQKQTNTIRHQISLVEICTASEKNKISSHIAELSERKRRFDYIFDEVRHTTELQKQIQKQSEEDENELLKQKENEIRQKIEQFVEKTIAVEKDSEAIERECVVLKKRNNAIMLKMRRKLIETENIRKDLLKKKNNMLIC